MSKAHTKLVECPVVVSVPRRSGALYIGHWKIVECSSNFYCCVTVGVSTMIGILKAVLPRTAVSSI